MLEKFKYQVRVKHSARLSHTMPFLGIGGAILFFFYLGIKLYAMHQWQPFGSRVVDEKFFNKTWHVQTTVSSLPVQYGKLAAWYFDVKVEKLLNARQNLDTVDFPKKIRLAWYPPKNESIIEPKLGETWRFWIKLKPINGQSNPGGFDYERWAFVKHIDVRGYVRNSTKKIEYRNRKILHEFSPNMLSQWRNYLRQQIEHSKNSEASKALLKALMIGDKSAISQQQWNVFRDAGVAHLLVISGLHIGLAAVFIGFIFGYLWRRSPRACQLISAPYVFVFSGLLGALVYALISGFEVPAQRALLMVVVAFFSLLCRRFLPNYIVLFIAFVCVLAIDIRAFYSTGFWLSFVSVGIIFIVLNHRLNQYPEPTKIDLKKSFVEQGKRIGSHVLFLQLSITICLIPVLLFFFQNASVISPLANLSITPLISMLIVPGLIFVLFLSWSPVLLQFFLTGFGYVLEGVDISLGLLVNYVDVSLQLPAPSLVEVIIATVTLLALFTVKSWKKKMMFSVIAMIAIIPLPSNVQLGDAKIHLLDVGQGLSVVVMTRNHTLIYDAGNRGMGRSVVYPFMNAIMRQADTIVISHEDIDHYGGSGYVLKKYPQSKKITWQDCKGEWLWDDVRFQLLQYDFSSEHQKTKVKDNNLSCMLKVTAQNGKSFLLTADIEKVVEKWLVEQHAQFLLSTVLLVPHQGSKSSSIPSFIRAVNPQYALISAGFNNHFGHPHPEVVKRYRESGIKVHSTICSGMISFNLNDLSSKLAPKSNQKTIKEYRKTNNYFWRRQCDATSEH